MSAAGLHVPLSPVRRVTVDTPTLLVAPEVDLTIPFGAPADETGQYLVQRFTFNYLAGGRRSAAGRNPRAGLSLLDLLQTPPLHRLRRS